VFAPIAREAVYVGPDQLFDELVEAGFDGFVVRGNRLAQLARVPRLRTIRVEGFAASQLETLVGLPGLAHVERLVLRAYQSFTLGAREGLVLADALDGMKSLRSLELTGFSVPRWPAWITRLTIRHARRGTFAAIATEALERLHLENCELDDAAIQELVGSGPAPRLEELVLPSNLIHDEGARAISGWSAPLLGIDLDTNPIDDGGVRALLARSGLRQLAIKGTGRSGPTAADLRILVEGRRHESLLYFTDEHDEDLRPLSEAQLELDRQAMMAGAYARPFPEPGRIPFLAPVAPTGGYVRAQGPQRREVLRLHSGPPPGQPPLELTTAIFVALLLVVALVIYLTLR
jgi:hypothetical protein